MANLEQLINMYEPEPREESAGTTKPEPTSGRRYPLRERRSRSTYASQYILLLECNNEVMANKHKEKWLSAAQDKMNSLHENYTYDMVELPKGKKALRNNWVYKVKVGEVDNAPRYKARIMVKGFQQKKGVNYDEIFAPIVKMTSIGTTLSMANSWMSRQHSCIES